MFEIRMKSLAFAIAIIWPVSTAAQAYVVPPIEQGVWLSQKVLPPAITSGDFSAISSLLTPETVLTSDEGSIVASGTEPIVRHLGQWYSGRSRVVSIYIGYGSLLISVERETERPWERAYTMVITCESGKISRMMIIQRNPNFSSTVAKAPGEP